MRDSSRQRRWLPWRAAALALCTSPVWLAGLAVEGAGQTATLRVDENLRVEPGGNVLARVLAGTELAVERSQGGWVEATLEGWIWAQSVDASRRADFDLVVSASGGENLRERPQGPVRARLLQGMLLQELERAPGWIRVRRTAWVWSESVRLEQAAEAPAVRRGAGPGAPAGADSLVWRTGAPSGQTVLAAPDGDTLARILPGAPYRITGRQGNWARVQLDGWTWLPGDDQDPIDSAVVQAEAAEVARAPDGYRGRLVDWDLQFISLERAERVRTDFYEGEPFLLARSTTGPGLFVYVAVPPERLDEVQDLRPLDRVRVLGRIRTGSSSLTGSPILDLVELRPPRAPEGEP